MNKNRFLKAREQFGSIGKVLEFLRGLQGFGSVDRSTIFRWEKALDTNLPQRSLLAIIALTGQKQKPVKLRIAEPRGLLALPSTLVWLKSTAKKESVIERLHGFQPEVSIFPTGGEGLQRMIRGEFDIVVAADILVETNRSVSCEKLAEISSSPFYVVTKFLNARNLSDFRGRKIGYPNPSVIPIWLERLAADTGIRFGKLSPFETPQAAREALQRGKIEAIVCWDWWVESIISKPQNTNFIVIPNIFGTHRLCVAVNQQALNPTALRFYLNSLVYVLKNLDYLVKTSLSLSDHLDMKKLAIETYFKAMNFNIKDLNAKGIVDFWSKEVAIDRTAQ